MTGLRWEGAGAAGTRAIGCGCSPSVGEMGCQMAFAGIHRSRLQFAFWADSCANAHHAARRMHSLASECIRLARGLDEVLLPERVAEPVDERVPQRVESLGQREKWVHAQGRSCRVVRPGIQSPNVVLVGGLGVFVA